MKNFKKMTEGLMMALMSIFLFGYHVANAQGNLVTVKSAKSFETTISALKRGVTDADMMVISEINHGNILSMTGLSIKAQSLFTGNPNVGKDAFADNMAVGLCIPIRVNVYEEKGATYVNYFTPSSELSEVKGEKVKMIGKEMDKKVSNLTSMVSK